MPDKRRPDIKSKTQIYTDDPLMERIRKIQQLIKSSN